MAEQLSRRSALKIGAVGAFGITAVHDAVIFACNELEVPGLRTVPGTNLAYNLICFDAHGNERQFKDA